MRFSTQLACFAGAALGISAAPALADDIGPVAMTTAPLPPGSSVAPPRDQPKAAPRTWYGNEMLIGFAMSDAATAASVATTVSGSGGAGFAFGLVGVSGHLLVGPITHWAHGNTARGFESLALNFGGIAVGSAAGMGIWAVAGPKSEGQQVMGVFPGFVLGGSIGLLAVNVVDTSVLAYDDKPRTTLGSLSLAPIVAPHRGGAALSGAF